MKLFRKIKREDSRQKRKSAGILAILRTAILKSQRKLADWLGVQSERLSPRGKRISLLLFGLIMGGFSLMLIINSFKGSSVNTLVFPQGIKYPSVTPGIGTERIMSPEEYSKLIHFRRMLDSLKQSPDGRTLYHEILQGRTGLLDSVDFLLSIYANQD